MLLIDGQGALIERFCLLILALILVEFGQVVETRCSVGMQWPQLLLTDGQGTLIERLCLLILKVLKLFSY